MNVSCRPATAGDLDAIAEIRVRSWQAAYRGLVPQAYLDALTPAAEAERRRARSGPTGVRPDDHGAEADGQRLGGDRAVPGRRRRRPSPGCGEIGAIYVLPGWWGRGVGRELMAYALGDLRRHGLTPVLLWVLAGNDRACRFYERAGFRLDGATHDHELAGATLTEVRYRHDG